MVVKIMSPVSVVASVESGNPSTSRVEKLMKLLNLNADKLFQVETQELKCLEEEYHDVFALDDSKLG